MASITVNLLDHYGNDLMVVNAARGSFDNVHTVFKRKADAGLIGYLAQNNHWTPFAHPQATFRISCPIPIARQQFKSTVGFIYSEVSRRYVSNEPSMFHPDAWRAAPTDGIKQGSGDLLEHQMYPIQRYGDAVEEGLEVYSNLLSHGVAPEQARFALPQGMMTTFTVTGSLAAWARFCNQRLDGHAQYEVRQIARKISKEMRELYPFSWQELVGDEDSIKGESIDVVKAMIRETGEYTHPAFKSVADSATDDDKENVAALNEWTEKNAYVVSYTRLGDTLTESQLEEYDNDIRSIHSFNFSKLTREGFRILCVYHNENGCIALTACPKGVFKRLNKGSFKRIS